MVVVTVDGTFESDFEALPTGVIFFSMDTFDRGVFS